MTQSADADRLLVVLDDDDGVAEVAHREQRVDELAVVALVQADRRLVENVEHAHELRADLRGEADALGLAARERRRAAREVEVADADVGEEAQAVLDLLQDLAGDLLLARRQPQVLEERDRRRRSSPTTTSSIDRPPTRTASASGLSRRPRQAGQGSADM